MRIDLDRQDLELLLRSTPGSAKLTLTDLGPGEISLRLVHPAPASFSLRDFQCEGRKLTARLTPWWVNKLAQLVLKTQAGVPVEIKQGRIEFELPTQLLERVELLAVDVTGQGVQVQARPRA